MIPRCKCSNGYFSTRCIFFTFSNNIWGVFQHVQLPWSPMSWTPLTGRMWHTEAGAAVHVTWNAARKPPHPRWSLLLPRKYHWNNHGFDVFPIVTMKTIIWSTPTGDGRKKKASTNLGTKMRCLGWGWLAGAVRSTQQKPIIGPTKAGKAIFRSNQIWQK